MKVIMIPYFGDGNPYQRLLATALEERGVSVRFAKLGGRRPLAAAVTKHGEPDVIHLHWQHRFFVPRKGGRLRAAFWTWLFFRDVRRLQNAGVRFVWTVHNVVNHERRYERWERFMCRRLARRVQALVVHCETARKIVARAYGVAAGRISAIEHGHYGGWYREPVRRRDARSELGLPASGLVYLYFGRIRSYKGVEDLLDAFGELEADDARLMVVGKVSTQALKETIARRCRRDPRVTTELQFVDEDRLVRYVSAADVVVLPYTRSLTSGSAVLAATLGRPVIAPKVGCLREMPDDCGILYGDGDGRDLVEALREAASAPLDEMGRRARERVLGKDWGSIARRTRNLYASVRGPPSGARPRAGRGPRYVATAGPRQRLREG